VGTSRYYLKENNFMLSRLSGEISNQALREHVLEFDQDTEEISNLREFVDCRKIESLCDMTTSTTLHDSQLVDSRPDYSIAIIVNESPLIY
jgi:hypothetical protein